MKFNDRIMNKVATFDNPLKYGRFVRYVTIPRGRVNSGKYIEYIGDDGEFHITSISNIKLLEDEND